ncbi:MAG: spermidine/putrescine ABC transporter permease PotC [Deltaproteobacteria bacterium CG11_big_fil_rev_8_21_14_0_20_45_16]|nr:MAG: spermidine/putrescine ABC transporter permease PotC [Deltaproteobacteria bacterium CG11_big_fil_rev_8_21_14_0_20_45_16]
MERSRPSPPWFAQTVTALTFLLLYIPLVVLVIYSFVSIDPANGQALFSLEWYKQALQDDELRRALNMSLWVGLWSTLGASIIGTATAWALDRFSFPGKQWLDALTLVPLVIPEIVMALSLLIWFVLLKFSLGSISIILAHITFSFSYVVITVRTRLADFDHSLEEAAFDLGATPIQTFGRVSFPLIWPGILSGALMAFTLSFDDFLITFFTAGVGSDTLPIKLYSMIKYGISPKINALSTLILLATIIMVIFAFRPKKSSQSQTEKLKAIG